MLELTCRVCFRVNIRNLLEFERCFHRSSIVKATSQKEHTASVMISGCQILHGLLTLQHFLQHLGQRLKLITECTLLFFVHFSTCIGQSSCNQIECCKLRRICLGGCNRNLRACPSIQNTICFACNGRGNHIDNCDCKRTCLLCLTHCRQRVGSLARLTDYDAQIIRLDDRILVTELRCYTCRAAYAANRLNDALTYNTCMQCRTTANDMHMIGFFQAVIGQAVFFKYDLTVTDTRLDSLRNCAGLLHDLLDHKVLVTTLFGCGHIPSNRAYVLLNRFAKCIEDLHTVRTNDCDLVVVQNHILTRASNDCGHIGRDHILSVAQTNDQRVVATRCDNFIRSIKRDNA